MLFFPAKCCGGENGGVGRGKFSGWRVFVALATGWLIIPVEMGPILERYRCPFCQRVNEFELARLLEEGETDLRGRVDEKQKLKLKLPGRMIVACDGCGREFVIITSGSGIILGQANNS